MEKWIERRRTSDEKHKENIFNSTTIDSYFQRDRARIIHSSSFRRLQSKTQILAIGEHDFYRTRLTHSLEVGQLATGICERFKTLYKDDEEVLKWIPSMSLIDGISLAHDIGHPPFGHGGETALNYSMHDHGGFEGNGQTLRILSKLGEFSNAHGLDLTRRTMLGIIKYPAVYSQLVNYPAHDDDVLLDFYKPPKCILDDELDVLEWILSPFSKSDIKAFTEIDYKEKGHHKTLHEAFDTSILELADDIAYGVHDFEDALALQLITQKQWDDDVVSKLMELPQNPICDDIEFYNKKLFSESNKERKHAISRLVWYLLNNVFIEKKEGFEHPLLYLQATLRSPAKEILDILKEFVYDYVIASTEVQIFEYKGQQLVVDLFQAFKESPKRLLPRDVAADYIKSGHNQRILCDYIASMSDNCALRYHNKLFNPMITPSFNI